jgi:DNA polymerase/3'-5' exonuclease PolX
MMEIRKMSDSAKRPYSHMLKAATSVVQAIAPYCERIEIAGSLRRCKPEIGDIEIVCIPSFSANLFGEPSDQSLLDIVLDEWLATGRLFYAEPKRWGDRYKAFQYKRGNETYKVDLFIQTAETWGMNLMIRTGSADFTARMLRYKAHGGLMPDDLTASNARVWRNGAALDTPEEADVFKLWGLDWIEPKDRT